MGGTIPDHGVGLSEKMQTRNNHARLDPAFHFFLLPGSFVTLVLAIFHMTRSQTLESAILVLLAIFVTLAAFKTRTYALRVQDRVIRMEERMRLSTLAPDSLRAKICGLTEDQLIGLRFAADSEAAALADRALKEKLNRKQIKLAIQNWRPDYWRV